MKMPGSRQKLQDCFNGTVNRVVMESLSRV